MFIVVGFFYVLKLQFPIYKVASNSMNPNFKIGAYLIANGLSNTEELNRNDVCIFNHQNKTYLSRIVGVSGDIIEIKEGILYVNKKKESNVITLSEYKLIVKKNINLSQLKLLKKLTQLNPFGEYKGVLSLKEIEKLEQLDFVKSIKKIVLPKGYQYKQSDVLMYSNIKWSRDNFGPIKIPVKGDKINDVLISETCYFVLGDNRVQSLDSRHFGFVLSKDIVGKVIH